MSLPAAHAQSSPWGIAVVAAVHAAASGGRGGGRGALKAPPALPVGTPGCPHWFEFSEGDCPHFSSTGGGEQQWYVRGQLSLCSPVLPLGVPPTPAVIPKTVNVWRVLTTTSDVKNVTQGLGLGVPDHHVTHRWCDLVPFFWGEGGQGWRGTVIRPVPCVGGGGEPAEPRKPRLGPHLGTRWPSVGGTGGASRMLYCLCVRWGGGGGG